MAQRVEFLLLPNTLDAAMLDRAVTVLAYIERDKPDFKKFRQWLRDQNLWKKEETPQVLTFLGVRGMDERGNVTLSAFARKLLAADTPDERKVALFEYLVEQNPILVKYVLEALDTDAGGRLHSTHELYRYITSYAYPGAYIKLLDFQNWVKWMEAAGGVRIIGIRWGLDAIAKAAMTRVRGIDVEEILEDEALDGSDADEGDDEAEAEAAAAPAPALAPVAPGRTVMTPAAAPPTATAPGEEEELPDMPPEAEPVAIDEAAAARFADQLGLDTPASTLAPTTAATPNVVGSAAAFAPARPERTALPAEVAVLRPLRAPALEGGISPQDKLETAKRVKAWWQGFPMKRRVRAAELGFDPKKYADDPTRFLLRLFTAAVVVDHEMPGAPVADFLRRLDEVDAFGRIGAEGGGLEAVLSDAGWFDGHLALQRMSENLVHTARFRARLAAHPEVLPTIEGARSGAKILECVHTDLFGGAFYLPPFWVIREMFGMGLWSRQPFAAFACVPSYRVRLSAFRLGFLDSFYAEGFPALREASQILSRFFGEDCDFDAPLEQLADGFGCQLRCPHVLTCPLACREKFSV